MSAPFPPFPPTAWLPENVTSETTTLPPLTTSAPPIPAAPPPPCPPSNPRARPLASVRPESVTAGDGSGDEGLPTKKIWWRPAPLIVRLAGPGPAIVMSRPSGGSGLPRVIVPVAVIEIV